jgi:hypothetical protein
LQPGCVHGETKLSVADAQRIRRVEVGQHDFVPRNKGVAVNPGGGRHGGKQEATVADKIYQAFHSLGFPLFLPDSVVKKIILSHGQTFSWTRFQHAKLERRHH